jgi:AcrR family transcriptional regulator
MVYRKTSGEQCRLDQRRADILSAAQRIVRQQGFGGAKIRPVAEAAGVSVGSVYSYFPDVQALHGEVFAEFAGRELVTVQAEVDGAGDPAAQLRRLVQIFATRALAAPRLAWALLAEPVSPAVERQRLAYRQEYVRLAAQIVDRGVLAGTFAPQSVLTTSRALVGAISESLVGPLNPLRSEVPQLSDDTVEDITVFCMRAAGVAPAARHDRQHRSAASGSVPSDSVPSESAAYEGARG